MSGTIEVRKNLDVAGSTGSEHLFVVGAEGTTRSSLAEAAGAFGPALVADLRRGTEEAVVQCDYLEVTRLALTAEAGAVREPSRR